MDTGTSQMIRERHKSPAAEPLSFCSVYYQGSHRPFGSGRGPAHAGFLAICNFAADGWYCIVELQPVTRYPYLLYMVWLLRW